MQDESTPDDTGPITLDELVEGMRRIVARLTAARDWPAGSSDVYYHAMAHLDADDLLLRYVNDPEVTALYEAIGPEYE